MQSTKTGKIFSNKWLVYKLRKWRQCRPLCLKSLKCIYFKFICIIFFSVLYAKAKSLFILFLNLFQNLYTSHLFEKITISNITADTVVIFFTLALVERKNPSNSNNIGDVINYLKKGFRLERDIFWQISRQWSFTLVLPSNVILLMRPDFRKCIILLNCPTQKRPLIYCGKDGRKSN
jgi:hypothetical protein